MVWFRFKKTRKISLILLAIILLAVSTVVIVFIGYRRVSYVPDLLISSIQEGANLSIGKVRQTATRDGRKEWSLEANSADYIESENKVILKELSITYFLENNREVYLDADQGILNTGTNDIEFLGNVVIRNKDYRLRTERLNYDDSRRVIFSKDPVNLAGDSAELSADAAFYDLNANKIVLSGKVEATIARKFELFGGMDNH